MDYPSGVSHFLSRMAVQSTEMFEDKDQVMSTLDQYGGIIDCQGFRYIVMLCVCVFMCVCVCVCVCVYVCVCVCVCVCV